MRLMLFLLALTTLVSQANAAKLVLVAVNSGTSNPPVMDRSQGPVVPGAKGFLFAVDSTTDPPNQPLGFQDLTFSGPNIVQRLADNSFANEFLDSPHVQTRSQSLVANTSDPVAASTFGRNDSWWWNATQNGLSLAPVSTGIEGGLPGGPMTMTGTFNLSGDVPPGKWLVAYVVATGNFNVSGLLAPGTDSSRRFNVLGDLPNSPNYNAPSIFYFNQESFIIPEPSSLVLFSLALIGLMAAQRGRRMDSWKG
jgi:hypothetical protein